MPCAGEMCCYPLNLLGQMSVPVSTKVRTSGDAFAIGVLVMLAVNVLQRSVGFLRGIGLATILSDVQLGNWALANSFLIITVPILVLGLPGSFGKFVEYFRKRDELGFYFSKALKVSVFGSVIGCLAILSFPDQFSWLVFGDSMSSQVVAWSVVCLLSTIAFSFMTELATGLRQVQVVSYMQFLQSFSFTIFGVALVFATRSWWVLLPSFAIANCIAMIPGWWKLRREHATEFAVEKSRKATGIWKRIVPFAASLWAMNLLSNLFEVGDRYMLLHFVGSESLMAPGSEHAGQAMVGQYHCARILPNLLVSVGVMLGGVLLPYLSADWEAGRQDRVVGRVRQVLQGISIGFLGLSVGAILTAPLLFHFVIGDRYQLAEQVLPLALAQAMWVAMFLVAEPYLLCAEKGKQLIALLILSLSINLGLNALLIPQYGLFGALVATSTANILALALLLWQMTKNGCDVGWGTVVLCATPITLLGGPVVATAALLAIVFVAGRTDWLVGSADREQIDQVVTSKLEKLGLKLESIWP